MARIAQGRLGLRSLVIGLSATISLIFNASGALSEVCIKQTISCCKNFVESQYQSSDRLFGFHLWSEDLLSNLSQAIELSPSAIRFALTPNWRFLPPVNVNDSEDYIDAYISKHLSNNKDAISKQIEAVNSFRKITRAKTIFLIWEPLRTNIEASTENRALREAAIPVTAEFYVRLIQKYQDMGLIIDMIELTNEPNGNWNIQIRPSLYVDLIRLIRNRANQLGIKLPDIIGPGTSSLFALSNYISDDKLARDIIALTDQISVHVWDEKVGRSIRDEAVKVRDRLAQLGYRKNVIVTEFSITDFGANKTDGAGADSRSENAASNGNKFRAQSADVTLELASLGFFPIVYWILKDKSWGSSSYGLIDLNNRERPTYEYISSINRQFPHGSIISTSSDRSLFKLSDADKSMTLYTNVNNFPVGLADRTEVAKSGECLSISKESPIAGPYQILTR